MKVFLGGTCNESGWREEMKALLEPIGVGWFDPVVDDWNDEARERELRERESCDFCLYTITPKMAGVYSIAEVVDDSNKRPDKTILVLRREDGGKRFGDGMWRSLRAVADMVERNGALALNTLTEAAIYISCASAYQAKGS